MTNAQQTKYNSWIAYLAYHSYVLCSARLIVAKLRERILKHHKQKTKLPPPPTHTRDTKQINKESSTSEPPPQFSIWSTPEKDEARKYKSLF